jgi:L-iditol 2-dehydrogenase
MINAPEGQFMWAQTLIAPGRFIRGEVPAPQLTPQRRDQVLLRVLAGGICGSDLPLFRGLVPLQAAARVGAPGYPMHEVVGEVLRSQDARFAPGERVVGWVGDMAGLCEQVVVSADDVQAYDPKLAPTTAILLQPLACVLSALAPLRASVPDRAAVIGLGPIGVLFTHVLKSFGVRHLTGVDQVDRSDVASAFGIDEAVHAVARTWVRGLPEADRPAVVVESVGHQVGTLEDAVDAVAIGGRIFYFGIPDDPVYPFPMHRFLRKDATLWSGYTRDKQAALSAARRYLKEHPDLMSSYVTDVFPTASAQAAFECAARPAVGRMKVVLDATASCSTDFAGIEGPAE